MSRRDGEPARLRTLVEGGPAAKEPQTRTSSTATSIRARIAQKPAIPRIGTDARTIPPEVAPVIGYEIELEA